MNGQVEIQKKSLYVQNVNLHTGTKKKCTRCKKTKSHKDFYRCDTTHDKLRYYCKDCGGKDSLKWQRENSERARENYRRLYNKNPDRFIKKTADWRKKNPEKNLETMRLSSKNNIKAIRKSRIKSEKKRRSTLKGRLHTNLSRIIRYCLNGTKNGKKWEAIVGYTLEELKSHLEKQFLSGMTWENYGRTGWHIDHKIPISVFNFNKPEDDDFKRCWDLSNLQPLWCSDNTKKRDKLYKHFQPMLSFQ